LRRLGFRRLGWWCATAVLAAQTGGCWAGGVCTLLHFARGTGSAGQRGGLGSLIRSMLYWSMYRSVGLSTGRRSRTTRICRQVGPHYVLRPAWVDHETAPAKPSKDIPDALLTRYAIGGTSRDVEAIFVGFAINTSAWSYYIPEMK
jgi:hypothetical protein